MSALVLSLALAAAGCGHRSGDGSPATRTRTLTIGAYTTPREAYGKVILPAFRKLWKQRTGEDVEFQESYLGSGAQARAIVAGFEADVAALSLETDIDKIAKAGLIRHDWRRGPHGGMVTRSIVVIAVRPGNPRGIHDWEDLTRRGVSVLTPNVRTSGGAMWNIAAIYGASMRGNTSKRREDRAAAEQLLRGVLENVPIMDKGARESMITFERGTGDAAITYENEVLVGRRAGQRTEAIVPRSTIRIENPAAVIDSAADRHHNRDIAEAFVAFLTTPEAQRAFVEYGLRPVDQSVEREAAARFPSVQDLFTIRDLGGWRAAERMLFAPGALYDRAVSAAQAAR